MIKSFYDRVVFAHPKSIFAFILLLLGVLGYYSTKLEIDASSNTLLIEGDKDLAYYQQVSKRFEGSNFLIAAFTPKEKLLAPSTIATLKELENEFESLEQITSVTALHNVPLITSQSDSLTDLADEVATIESLQEFDKEAVKNELLNNPLYNRGLVSKDFQTTAIMLYLKEDEKYRTLNQKIHEAKQKVEQKPSKERKQQLANLQQELKAHRDSRRNQDAQTVAQVRSIISDHQHRGELFLGGVNMIAADVISFIKSDLKTYGSLLTLLLILILYAVFKDWRWVVLPIVVCLASVVAATGTFGFFGKEVTVLSSNFISLQLIITISLILHLIVRYRELAGKYLHATNRQLVTATVLSKFNPSVFAILTTVAGFGSLVFSDIKPVIDLGVMMSVAILLSLLLVFLLFPLFLILGKKIPSPKKLANTDRFMTALSNSVIKKKAAIFAAAGIAVLFSVTGAKQLIVENSFIDYFKESTEIYQGMKIIDEKLGGTTPLDVIVTLESKNEPDSQPAESEDEFGFGGFEEEFSQDSDDPKYWFSKQRLEAIKKIQQHLQSYDAIGDVQSLATLLEVGKQVENKELDSFQLAVLYEKIPQKYRKLVLSPYLDIENNQIRYSMRVIDSTQGLRRDALLKDIKAGISDLDTDVIKEVRLTNLMVMYNNMLQSLFQSQILTLGFVAVALFVMFYILFRSLALAAIALVTNIVPISVIFGIMGWFGIPLDIMTITIAAISIGIGVDDTIHYIDRFKIEYLRTKDYRQAMKNAHSSVGYAMSYTTLTVVVGFSILVFSNFVPTIYFGLLTVLVMALLLTSALMLLPRMLITFQPKIA